MTRDELQEFAARRLENEKRLIAQWCTGLGKSGIVLKFLKQHPDYKCLILVPESNNIENWLAEFEKFNVPSDNVMISCYASFHKHYDTKWDLLVFDEMPHVDTEKRLAICNSVSGEYILALGAMITEEERNSLETVYGEFAKTSYSLSRAIENKLLPTPQFNVFYLKLDDTERRYEYKGKMYTAKQRYDWIQRRSEEAKRIYDMASNKFNLNRMLSLGAERKRFLGQFKEDALRRLCDQLCLKKKRFICFCSSIEQANRIGKDHAFTSKTPTSAKLLDKFNNHEIDSLYVVGKLIEGQNLKDIEVGVIGQLGGTDRITVQQCGRIMRSENPVIYVLVFNDTQDNKFLRTLTSNVPKDYIKEFQF